MLQKLLIQPTFYIIVFFYLPPKAPGLIKGALKSEWPPVVYNVDVQLVQSLFLTLNEKLFDVLLSPFLSVLVLTPPPLHLNLRSSPEMVRQGLFTMYLACLGKQLMEATFFLSIQCLRHGMVFCVYFKTLPNTNPFIRKWVWVRMWTFPLVLIVMSMLLNYLL